MGGQQSRSSLELPERPRERIVARSVCGVKRVVRRKAPGFLPARLGSVVLGRVRRESMTLDPVLVLRQPHLPGGVQVVTEPLSMIRISDGCWPIGAQVRCSVPSCQRTWKSSVLYAAEQLGRVPY